MQKTTWRQKNIGDFLDQSFPLLRQGVAADELSKLEFFKDQFLDSFEVDSLLFECPLNEKRKWVDLSFKIDPFSENFSQSIQHLQDGISKEESWKRCLCFLSKTKFQGLYFIELDIGSGKENPLLPNLFVCTKEFQGEKFLPFATHLSEELQGHAPSQLCMDNLQKYAEVCSAMQDQIFACGLMLARPNNGIRVHAGTNLADASTSLEERLKTMGYVSSIDALMKLLRKLPSHALKSVGYALDIADHVGPKVGIEIFPPEKNSKQDVWLPLLEILMQEGVAEQESVNAYMKWKGGLLQPQPSDHDFLFIRRINHIKLVSQPGQKIEAKIYLNHVHGQVAHPDAADFPFEYT
ncbi:MAG: hypothetical protein ACHQT8_06230 [Chlamydiales bacterium]